MGVGGVLLVCRLHFEVLLFVSFVLLTMASKLITDNPVIK